MEEQRSGQTWRVARVVGVEKCRDGSCDVTFMVGQRLHQMQWNGEPPVAGDAFLAERTNPLTLGPKIGAAIQGEWKADGDGLRWRSSDVKGRTRLELLWQRHAIRRAVRAYLDAQDFIEIDMPLLVRGTTQDVAINSFTVEDRYLISSAEYQIKRLEVGGFDRVYTITQNFRRGDASGTTRNPEFTMLEWARVGEGLSAIEADVEQFTWQASRALGGAGSISYGGRHIRLDPPWERLTVAEAIARATGVAIPEFSLSAITRAVKALGITVQDQWRDDLPFMFSLLMAEIQPSLGQERPLFVREWPAFETSSASATDGMADRSEVFIGGVELCDGFASLTDYEQQCLSFARQAERRRAAGMAEVGVDIRYLEALKAGLPQGAGMALGFDRLVMVLTGCEDISAVLAFSWSEL